MYNIHTLDSDAHLVRRQPSVLNGEKLRTILPGKKTELLHITLYVACSFWVHIYYIVVTFRMC